METIIKVSKNQYELAWELARELAGIFNKAARQKRTFSVALSGGTTPKLLFSILGTHFNDKVRWNYIHFFWGDERCVPPHDPQSNFGMTKEVFLGKITVPPENIHRIMGEEDPGKEAQRYSQEILATTVHRNNLPVFDLIILGLGEDGHTASLFPGSSLFGHTNLVCDTTRHPVSGQKRITLTLPVINNAENIIFLVAGITKAQVVADLIENPGITNYPAALVEPEHGVLKWYLDMDAASMLSQWA